jgi:hypothetical protein
VTNDSARHKQWRTSYKHEKQVTMDSSDVNTENFDNRTTRTAGTMQDDELERMLLQAERLATKMRSSVSVLNEEAMRGAGGSRNSSHNNLRSLSMAASSESLLSTTSPKGMGRASVPSLQQAQHLHQHQQSIPYLKSPQQSMEDLYAEPPPYNASLLGGSYSLAGTKMSLMSASRDCDDSIASHNSRQSSHQSSHRSMEIEAAVKASREMELALKALGVSRQDSDEVDLTQDELLRRDDVVVDDMISPHSASSLSQNTSPHAASPDDRKAPSMVGMGVDNKENATPEKVYKMRQGDLYDVDWDSVSTIKSQDDDYVPLSDYSKKDADGNDYVPMADYSKSSQTRGSVAAVSSMSSVANGGGSSNVNINSGSAAGGGSRNTHTHGVKWEKMNFVEFHDDDYTPMVDYSKFPPSSSASTSSSRQTGRYGERDGGGGADEYASYSRSASSSRHGRKGVTRPRLTRKRVIRWIVRSFAALVAGIILYGLLFPRSVPDLRSANPTHTLVDPNPEPAPVRKTEADTSNASAADAETKSLATSTMENIASLWNHLKPWPNNCYVPIAWLVAENCHDKPRHERLESILDRMFE